MKAIKIDVTKKTVEYIDITDTLNDLYEVIDCSLIDHVFALENGDTMYMDDEALLRENIEGVFYFKYPKEHLSVLVPRNAVLLGCDITTGESIDVKSSLEEITSCITFLDDKESEHYLDWYLK